MGALHPQDMPDKTLVLIGAGSGCWPTFTTAPEYRDGRRNPLDRWSKRIIGDIAQGARTLYPSDGPPYAPFIVYALATGRFHASPTGMMVHDVAGLMISIRGAIALNGLMPLSAPQISPCETCADQPCTMACPVGALSTDQAYDVPICKNYLNSLRGQTTCMTQGCAVRIACPVSQSFDRDPAQSAFHMRAFSGAET